MKDGQRLEDQPIYKRTGPPTPEARREKLMPFFWGTLMATHGSIAGNPALGSRVHLTNRHWFSYPGYSEILVGRAHDDVIKSNDPVRNPNRDGAGVPAVVRRTRRDSRSRAFASWDVFNAIVEHTRGRAHGQRRLSGVRLAGRGESVVEASCSSRRRRRGTACVTMPTPFDSRWITSPVIARACSICALGETDDWAHDGRYDRVLETYTRTDRYLKELWEWLQSQPEYRGPHAHPDHDRSRPRPHAGRLARPRRRRSTGASETWMAFVSPSWSKRGEWRKHPPLTASQAAATLIAWMGGDWKQFSGAAAPRAKP